MDTNSPNQYVNKNTKLPIILLITIAIVILFSVLIYLKVIPLQNFINPTNKQPISTPTTNSDFVNAEPIKIYCPTIKVVCNQGYGVFEDRKFFGLGYKLASKNPIYAAFDGTLTVTTSDKLEKKPQEKFAVGYLENKTTNFRAQYYLKGSMNKSGLVQKGDQIGTVNGDQISAYDNSSLVFSFFLDDPDSTTLNSTPIIIHSSHFE